MTRTTQFIAAGIAAAFVFASAIPSYAQSSRIEEALTPKNPPSKTRSLTRSLNASPADAAEQKVLQKARTRAISVEAVAPATKEEREEIAKVIVDKPKIDIAIFFDYNSDVIGPKAIAAVNELGVALLSEKLKGSVIMLNGHTDAAGSANYNLDLSHRRAQSVRKYLIHTFKIPEDKLLVAGFGFERLKLPDQPLSGENRRVEVVNASN
ncbi:OmpA family protein [Pseudorhodoplanes sp.]|uniref:OmpA family protein n=1 Tax=Pseudorhodoplanes sp. TaxID=1934341 RepID=UPI002CF08C99|nr:OmpA family protein [Pseudorhodoplanes sp.]HWV52105.1 OmpA family protein [Pseudorhodoplanes sp.]